MASRRTVSNASHPKEKTMHAIKDMFVTGNAHVLETPARGIR
jgi:hypothetical protein